MNPIQVLHISDWHCRGELPNFFEELAGDRAPDVLVITGDMLYDGPNPWLYEEAVQKDQLFYWERLYRNLRQLFPKIPILAVPGNHDRINYAQPWNEGDNFRAFDIPRPDVVEIQGVKFCGFRGTTSYAKHGVVDQNPRWPCELGEAAQYWIENEIPRDIEVLMTHSPPWGIRDWNLRKGKRGHYLYHMGFPYIRDLHEKLPELRAHLFGHIHEQFGIEKIGQVLYSNASERWQFLTLGGD